MSCQIEMISLDELVSQSHQYRKFVDVFNFAKVKHHLKSVEKDANYKGYGVERFFQSSKPHWSAQAFENI